MGIASEHNPFEETLSSRWILAFAKTSAPQAGG